MSKKDKEELERAFNSTISGAKDLHENLSESVQEVGYILYSFVKRQVFFLLTTIKIPDLLCLE
jgi:hypothetical protein